jgi:hypothetical protein
MGCASHAIASLPFTPTGTVIRSNVLDAAALVGFSLPLGTVRHGIG